MTQDLSTPAVEQTPAPDPIKERARIKRLIRNGTLPRYKIQMTKVKTGAHPKQHRVEFKLVSTLALLMKDLEPKAAT